MLKSKNIKIGFAGLSHLGLTHALGAAEKDFDVVAYDNDFNIVSELINNKMRVSEPSFDELFNNNKDKILITNYINDLYECDIVYISKDVPTNSGGESDLTEIQSLIKEVIKVINKETILVILCQVPPGFTRSIKCNNKIYYQVETLIFGEAIKRFLFPERLIVGTYSTKEKLDESYKNYLSSFNCPLFLMNYESAELTKISINIFLVSSVTITNILSEISENIGADWSDIIPALKADKRIGKFSYINPGLGISGGNLERDLSSILKIGNKYNTFTKTIDTFFENSNHRKKWIYNILKRELVDINQLTNISILGITYKENTDSVKNSPALSLIKKLEGNQIKVYDPIAKNICLENVSRIKTINECIENADVLILATAWDQFRNIKIKDIMTLMRGKIIIDPYRLLKYEELTNQGFKVFNLGRKN